MCPHCRAFITTKDRVCPYCNERVGPPAVARRDPGTILGGFIPHAHFTTVIILLVNFGLFAATTLYNMQYGVTPDFGVKKSLAILRGGQWWRLITAGYLHGGIMHILMNSWALFDLGAQVEEVYGTRRMFVFYTLSSAAGFLASAFWTMTPSLGASAGIFGLIGAMIALGTRHRSALGDAIRGLYVRWAIYGLLMGLLPFFNVDNAAHIGGLAAGFGIAYLAGLPGPEGGRGEGIWQIASWAAVASTVLSFLLMFRWFFGSAE